MFKKTFLLLALLFFSAACATLPPELTPQQTNNIENPPAEVVENVNFLLPDAIELINLAEKNALENGRKLTESELEKAQQLLIKQPEKIRVWVTHDFPSTKGTRLQNKIDLSRAGGFTAGYGIYVKPRHKNDFWLIVHELVHVAQFEEMGHQNLIRRYLTELAVIKNNIIPLERDAIARSERLLGHQTPAYNY